MNAHHLERFYALESMRPEQLPMLVLCHAIVHSFVLQPQFRVSGPAGLVLDDFLRRTRTSTRCARGTRQQTRSLSCHDQAVLVLRWFLDGTRVSPLARDNAIGKSTGYDYLHEGIDVLAARSPSLHGALLAAKAAG